MVKILSLPQANRRKFTNLHRDVFEANPSFIYPRIYILFENNLPFKGEKSWAAIETKSDENSIAFASNFPTLISEVDRKP